MQQNTKFGFESGWEGTSRAGTRDFTSDVFCAFGMIVPGINFYRESRGGLQSGTIFDRLFLTGRVPKFSLGNGKNGMGQGRRHLCTFPLRLYQGGSELQVAEPCNRA